MDQPTTTPPLQKGALMLFSDIIEAGFAALLDRIPLAVGDQSNRRSMVQLCWHNLLERLTPLVEPTIMAHFLLAEPELSGSSSDEKFLMFTDLLNLASVKAYFHDQFPLLFDRINRETTQWVEHSSVLITRLTNDRHVLIDTLFHGEDPGSMTELQSGMGDKHHGESVSLLHFKNHQKVVYVPRNRPLHTHLNELCSWLDRSLNIGFKLPTMIDRGDYCWLEFIPHTPCRTHEQVHRFYERTGVWLAVLYTLDATDFHHENLIACGEYPVLVDLETFFHPFMPFESGEKKLGILNSVLKTGLLPTSYTINGAQRTDTSGLNNAEGAVSEHTVLGFTTNQWGEVGWNRQKGVYAGGNNLPVVDGAVVGLSTPYINDLKQGFGRAYLFVLKHKEAYLDRIQVFRHDDIRLLFRNTAAYSHLMREGMHPDTLRSEAAMNKHLEWLEVVKADYPETTVFIAAEKEDMLRGDVPYFFTRADSTAIWHGNHEIASGFFHQSGFDTAVDKIKHLSLEDMEQQRWIIDLSLSLLKSAPTKRLQPFGAAVGTEKRHGAADRMQDGVGSVHGGNERLHGASDRMHDEKDKVHGGNERIPSGVKRMHGETVSFPDAAEKLAGSATLDAYLIETACRLADALIGTMRVSKDTANWMVFRPLNLDASRHVLAPASYDLYSGMPGEICCLSLLSAVTGKEAYRAVADKAMNELCQRIESGHNIQKLGLFTGWGGLIYTQAFLANLYKDKGRMNRLQGWLSSIKPCELVLQEKNHGVVNGAAGFILGLMSAYTVSRVDAYLELAEKMGTLLLRQAIQTDDQIRWKGYSKRPLAGLSHGASGYALCFSRLYQYTGNKRYKDAVRKILNYESYLFDPTHGNWPDLRDFMIEQEQSRTVYSTAWSHGAPGIGLVRLELLKSGIKHRYVERDLEQALETCLKHGFTSGDNLCFGSFGNIELLINYADYYGNQALVETYRNKTRQLLEAERTNGFNVSGLGTYTPGLMNGISGIIYQCLRVYAPKRVPSILCACV